MKSLAFLIVVAVVFAVHMAHRKKSVTLVWTEILDFRITCSHEWGGIFEF